MRSDYSRRYLRMGWRYPSPNGYFVPLVDTIWHPWNAAHGAA